MKTIIILMIAVYLLCGSCDYYEIKEEKQRMELFKKQESLFINELSQPHKLRKMFVRSNHIHGKEKSETANSSGGFFFIIGGYSYNKNSSEKIVDFIKTQIIISWLYEDSYITTTIPFDMLQISFGNEPSISFHLNNSLLIEKTHFSHRKDGEWCSFDANKQPTCSDTPTSMNRVMNEFYKNKEYFFRLNLIYAKLTIPEEMWEEQIQLPMNTKDSNSENITGVDADHYNGQ